MYTWVLSHWLNVLQLVPCSPSLTFYYHSGVILHPCTSTTCLIYITFLICLPWDVFLLHMSVSKNTIMMPFWYTRLIFFGWNRVFTRLFKYLGTVFKEMNTFIQQGCISLHLVKAFTMLQNISVSKNGDPYSILIIKKSNNTNFLANYDNNRKCFLSTKTANQNFWRIMWCWRLE